ncbi:hypothetical protein [Stagnihabitans tardus]|uniref:Uncharacterized protein n=1 Tax=Stagnihabitans tardus TaxID=2699202 RepID=A0AAE4YAI0_9RHOB|nr:hypothetical protein [Stagnihabitans tardus]NBZ89068.1 hypothetical protein [Stagnihabitans tardus]
MFKIVIIFLMVMLIISMAASAVTRFLRGPIAPPRVDKAETRAKCGHCGRPVLGTAPCVCGKG